VPNYKNKPPLTGGFSFRRGIPAFRRPATSSLQTCLQEKIALQNATGISHPPNARGAGMNPAAPAFLPLAHGTFSFRNESKAEKDIFILSDLLEH
jgi:hypothetical protein